MRQTISIYPLLLTTIVLLPELTRWAQVWMPSYLHLGELGWVIVEVWKEAPLRWAALCNRSLSSRSGTSPIAIRLREKLEVAWMERSAIRGVYAQHGTFLISVRFAELPGLRAVHSIQATFNTEIL